MHRPFHQPTSIELPLTSRHSQLHCCVSRPSSSTFPRDHDRSVSPPLATLKPTKCMPLATLGRGAGEKTFSSRPSPLATLKPTKCMPLATLGKGAEESQRCVSSRVPGTFLVTVYVTVIFASIPSSTKSTSRGRAFLGASLSFLHLSFFPPSSSNTCPFMIYGRAFSDARLFPIYLHHFYCPTRSTSTFLPGNAPFLPRLPPSSESAHKAFFFFSLEPLLFSFLLFYNDSSLVVAICNSPGYIPVSRST